MVLGSLLGHGASQLVSRLKSGVFNANDILYIGLQPIHDYQEKYLLEMGVNYKIQDKSFVSNDEIRDFIHKFDHVLIHFDIDVLDEHYFHSTYFANPELVGDGSGGGKMKIDTLTEILQLITDQSDVVGFTVAEYLPFDEHKLHKMFSSLQLFTE